MMMIGDPGTGKSMLARSMTELLPQDKLEDILCYPNDDDENEPRVRTVPAGRGDRIVKSQKEAVRFKRKESENANDRIRSNRIPLGSSRNPKRRYLDSTIRYASANVWIYVP